MIRGLVLLAVAGCAALSGCTACCGPFDHTYSAYGGRWQREDPSFGRVGSVIVPAGVRVEDGGPSTETDEEVGVEESDGEPPASQSTQTAPVDDPTIQLTGFEQAVGEEEEPAEAASDFDASGQFHWGLKVELGTAGEFSDR